MGIVPVLLVLPDVTEGQKIQLLLIPVPCSINRKQNGECNAASAEADDCEHLQIAQIKISVERVVCDQIFVGDLPERIEPPELGIGELLRPRPAPRSAQLASPGVG
jgi:hypothetical protein